VKTWAILAAHTVLLALGCAGPPPPPAPPPITVAPPPAPSAAPTAARAASAAPARAYAPIDPAADQDKLALVGALCPAAIQHREGKVRVGCRTCPPFDGSPPDGEVRVDPETFLPLEKLYRGAFSRAGADEVAAVFEGCEPHAANYGGTLFAEKTATGYRTITYASGLHPASCEVYHRPDERDVLVCSWSDAHQSTGFTQILYYDLTQAKTDDPLAGWNRLVTVSDNSYSVCWGVSPEGGVTQGSVLGFRIEDRNGDRVPDVVVEVMHRNTPYSPAMDKAIKKKCAEEQAKKPDDAPIIDVPKLLGKPIKETLEFLGDQKGFKPAPRTAPALKKFGG
jgi:hypothetical protein